MTNIRLNFSSENFHCLVVKFSVWVNRHDFEMKKLYLQYSFSNITKTRLYNFDPLKPHFYIVKLGFTGVHVYIIFLISAQKHRLCTR